MFVTGLKGRGKTVFTIYTVKSLHKISFIAIDGAWQLGSLGYCVHYPERLRLAFEKFRRVVFQPYIQRNQNEDEVYEEAFGVCRNFRNYLLIVDEVDEHAPTWGFKSGSFRELVKRGRPLYHVGLISNSRRPHEINKAIRNNADFVVCFQIVEDDDLKYMSKWIDTPKQQIKRLKPYYSYIYDVKKGTTKLTSPCPMSW